MNDEQILTIHPEDLNEPCRCYHPDHLLRYCSICTDKILDALARQYKGTATGDKSCPHCLATLSPVGTTSVTKIGSVNPTKEDPRTLDVQETEGSLYRCPRHGPLIVNRQTIYKFS